VADVESLETQSYDPCNRTVSVKEAAFRLHKSPDAIYAWLRAGRLQGFQPGGRGCSILVLESSLEQVLLCSLS
jgi:hypothetical protein